MYTLTDPSTRSWY